MEDNPLSQDGAMVAEKLRARYKFNALNSPVTILTEPAKFSGLDDFDTILGKSANPVGIPSGAPALYGGKT